MPKRQIGVWRFVVTYLFQGDFVEIPGRSINEVEMDDVVGPNPSLTPDGLAQSDPNLDSWGSEAPRVYHHGIAALTPTVGRVRSPKGLPTEYNGKRLTAPDPDRAFNAILGRCVLGTSRPDRTAIYLDLTPDRLKPKEAAKIRPRQHRRDRRNLCL
ncbi:hypothetical protein PanWU01x14_314950 [Parasponia andersonii]|uniref:Uncharacterized protein n=1 Tax=Parasponia andersonii TaxID=3476 RepID=A0A2P5ANJ0_PARAD|nr:hypothetical protein PanWU01x14_314950 [Parasponia andersonii]